MSRVKILNILLLILTITSCSILDPYIDRRRNPGTSDINKLYSGQSKVDAPAICYNPLLNTLEDLQNLANAECVKNNTGSRAEFIEKNNFSCKILLPATAYYQCIK